MITVDEARKRTQEAIRNNRLKAKEEVLAILRDIENSIIHAISKGNYFCIIDVKLSNPEQDISYHFEAIDEIFKPLGFSGSSDPSAYASTHTTRHYGYFLSWSPQK